MSWKKVCSIPLYINPFTPKSDQCQISPAASLEILHHTVWRTWLFVAYSDERWLCCSNSHYLTCTFPFRKGGRINFSNLGVKWLTLLFVELVNAYILTFITMKMLYTELVSPGSKENKHRSALQQAVWFVWRDVSSVNCSFVFTVNRAMCSFQELIMNSYDRNVLRWRVSQIFFANFKYVDVSRCQSFAIHTAMQFCLSQVISYPFQK